MNRAITTLLVLLLLPFAINTLARQNRATPISLPAASIPPANSTLPTAAVPPANSTLPAGSLLPVNSVLSAGSILLPAAADTSIVCTDTTLHLLLIEDTLAITAGHITKTRDGNILIPGYCHPDNGINYTLPYLIKCTPAGKVIWSKLYTNSGGFHSNWFSAYSVAELTNGDLLLTGQIGVPGTDDRRELAVWRLDGKGNLLWSASYASTLWTNPITGATGITGIREDAEGNIFLAGDNKLFEASKFAFILKLDAKGAVLWDNDYAGNSIFSYGVVLLQNKLLLIGGLDPSNATDTSANNELWCLQLNPDNGHLLVSKAWLADFGSRSAANSFYYANTSVILLDNGQISIQGTAHADYLGLFASRPGNINHSIIADFSPDLTFHSGILLGSARASNYYNTVASQQENGRTSFARVVENNNLYNEDIVYGHLQPDGKIKERIYHENNRSIQATSNFLFFPPGEDIIVQSFWDSTAGKGGLELLRLRDEDSSIVCNGKDTSISFILPYAMKTSAVQFDAIIANTFYSTDHNTVSSGEGHLAASSACRLAGAKLDGSPIVSLNQDSVLCQGSTRQLIAGAGGHDRYLWNTGDTTTSLLITDTGRYWVVVTDQEGCKGSDSTHITKIAAQPAGFLPPDTTICQFDKFTIVPLHTYQRYLWNDESTAATLTVSQPGLYKLDVTDSNQCTGSDSMRLTQKQCLEGFFIPNAFTPDGGGRNALFRPLLLGHVDRLVFTIFNRWGEKVFETQTPGQGWNGRLQGNPLPAGTFIWECTWQMDGQPPQHKNGTLLLIR